tara:strand:+ start:3606 stop:4802 length:1197 start_codon:yes stop_codon:yes gene_type:complete
MIKTDFLIIGGGMVGLSLANQIKESNKLAKIIVVEKEKELGLHSSGRNSGVLHAGIYYKPDSLKAKVCIEGAKRLKKWCNENDLKVLECGKVISVQSPDLDGQLDQLYERGIKNGANIEIIDEKKFIEIVPDGRTTSGRAIWSPKTAVVSPKDILKKLELNLKKQGVEILKGTYPLEVFENEGKIILSNKESYSYGHLYNAAGLQADKIAHLFGVGNEFTIYPFKGIYWELSKKAPFKFNTNLYPVPDLNVPFLGVHITPSLNGTTYLGPTAIPAFGRENYSGAKGIEIIPSIKFFKDISKLFFINKGGFRKYATEQALNGLKPFFIKSARLLVPNLETKHLIPSKKVGIRSQLFNKNESKLVDDFIMLKGSKETHILNAISPAFTASFALADHILSD